MPIARVQGTILRSRSQTLTNTVNCVGVMGKGIAQKFKRKYPEMFEDYALRCGRMEVKPGVPYVYKVNQGLQILNFPTKDHWRGKSKFAWIENGLDHLVEHWSGWDVLSLAVPPLGCGHGGLDWADVEPLIYAKLGDLPIQIDLYIPDGERVDPDQLSLDMG